MREEIQQMNYFINSAQECAVMIPLRDKGRTEICLEYRKGLRMENRETALPCKCWTLVTAHVLSNIFS